MRAHIIYSRAEAARNQWYIEHFFAEGAKRGMDFSLLIEERLSMCLSGGKAELSYDGAVLPRVDFALCRTQNPPLSRFYEQMGVPVFNSARVSEICNNKFNTYQLAAALDIPFLPVRCTAALEEAPAYPFVLKPLCGKGGRGVFLVRDDASYREAYAHMNGKPHLLQRVAGEPGRDLRIYMIGGEIAAAFLRTSNGDFRSNYCLGGSARACRPGAEERRMAERIAAELKPGLIGIDFLFDGGCPVLGEIEDVVGARMVYDLSDTDIAAQYLDHIMAALP